MGWNLKKKNRASAKTTDSKAGGGCLVLFGMVFAGMGLLFTVLLVRQLIAEAATYQWIETLCQIESSEIVIEPGRDSPFRLSARYSYEFDGQHHESTQYSLQEKWTDNYEKLALKRRDLIGGDGTVCHLNPANPAEAVIHRENLLTGLFVLIPLLFVVIGGGIIWAGIATIRAKKSRALAADRASIAKPSVKSGRKTGAIVGLVFALVGLGAGIPMAMGPLRKMVESRHWLETPCTVIWSRVLSHDSDDGTTYSVDIFYEYAFGGQLHRSNRYRFMSGSSSGQSGKAAVVRQYPEGSRQVCYVNPEVPELAVLKPGITPMALVGVIPLAFLLIGSAVFIGSIRSRTGTDPSLRPDANGLFTGVSTTPEGAIVLCPKSSRMMKTGGCLLISVFWNGIVSIFIFETYEGWKSGGGDWFQTLFMIPFAVIGLGMILGFFYQLLSLANPKPTITLPGGAPRIGEPFEITWELAGRSSRVTTLTISLWGVESATYRRGTDTTTSHEVFYEATVARAIDEMDIRTGRATIALPEDMMYSFKLPNNEIRYQIRVSGDVPLWPDITDHYDLTLLPRRSDPVASEI